jgi:hypothetical protein
MKGMSPKRRILKALAEEQGKGGSAAPVRPSTIPGFEEAPEKYQQTINILLKDRLIEGFKDEEGKMAISLNTHRQREVRRVLRPVWAHPAVLIMLLAVFAAAGVSLLI